MPDKLQKHRSRVLQTVFSDKQLSVSFFFKSKISGMNLKETIKCDIVIAQLGLYMPETLHTIGDHT